VSAISDYHFLYINAALGANWLFVAARRYWAQFQPIVIDNLDLVSYVPSKSTATITILARRDLAPKLMADVKKRFPRATVDPLVYDTVEDMKLTLDGRADLQQRFGVPETPTPTPTSKP
jgi:hypothetical protein